MRLDGNSPLDRNVFFIDFPLGPTANVFARCR